MANVATVYLVTNTVNGKRYVGVTRFTVQHRWAQHCYNATSGKQTWLYDAIRKYGVDAFFVQPIASCLRDPSAVERQVIKAHCPEYNQTNGGEVTVGRKHSPETVAKIAASNRGKKRTPEQNAANSARKKALYASNPELLEIVRANARKGLAAIDREALRAITSKASRGRKWSDEARAKMSASCMGRVYSQDIIEKGAAKKRKRVECITLGISFPSALHAADFLGIHNSAVGKVCRGKLKTAGGYQFKFIGG